MDKILHFVAGAAIALLFIVGSYSISDAYNVPINKSVIISAGGAIGTIAGIIKEIRDSMGYGTPEALDAIATSAGAITVSSVFYLILKQRGE